MRLLRERPQVFSFEQRLHTGPLPAHTAGGKAPRWADSPAPERLTVRQSVRLDSRGWTSLHTAQPAAARHHVVSPSNSEAARATALPCSSSPCARRSRPTSPRLDPDTHSSPLAPSALSGTKQHQCWVSTKGQEDGE